MFFVTMVVAAKARDTLEQKFQNPPPECRPDVFYQVMGGAITKEGLTKDLEAMKREGIGGVLLMQMPDQLAGIIQWPFRDYPGKLRTLSDEWFAIWNFAIGECDRLGLTFSTVPCPGWSHVGGPWVTPEKSLKVLVAERTKIKGPQRFDGVIPRAPRQVEDNPHMPPWAANVAAWKKLKDSLGDYYHDVAVIAFPTGTGTTTKPVPSQSVVDLTGKMDAQGRLRWDVPKGTWTVMRLGCASFNGVNHPAQLEGTGLECDRMDPEAVHPVLDNYVGRMLREARAKGYKSFKGFDTDSYEAGYQNFGLDIPVEFQKRMGYDCRPWLPAWYDKRLVIGTKDLTGRFRRDMEQVVSDLWSERFYAEIKRYAVANGIQWMVEPYFRLTIDWRSAAAHADLPGCEFWIRERLGHSDQTVREMIGPAPDIAALYGQKVVWSEAFTAGSENSAWRNDPWVLKPFGDAAFCRGINQITMHGFVHNPFGDQLQPGFSFGYWGTQLSRYVTWWRYSLPWHQYLARCALLLRQGLPVADVLVYPPKIEPIPKPILDCSPYKQTVCNDETLLKRLSVKDGRLVLPHGVSFAALAIPPAGSSAYRSVTPQALARILALVNDGATLIGEPVPAHSASMQNYPQCDLEMKKLIASIWGEGEVAKQGQRKVGKGRVIWGRELNESLALAAEGPDFEFVGLSTAPPPQGTSDIENVRPRYDYFHRRASDAEIYFIANIYDEPIEKTASFRVTDRKPELWDPVTGKTRPLPESKEDKGHTMVPMQMTPRQSCFVVFPKVSRSFQDFGSLPRGKKNFPVAKPAVTIEGPWQVAFDPKWGGPAKVEFAKLEDWTKRPEAGIKYYSGTATYTKTFDAPPSLVGNSSPAVYLDLGKVKNLARVQLNGKSLGIVWCAPWQVKVDGVLKEKDNVLQIEVVNTWINRILGDEQLPNDAEYAESGATRWAGGYIQGVKGKGLTDLPDWLLKGQPRPSKRYTFVNWQFYPKDAPLVESGLIGPVRITAEE